MADDQLDLRKLHHWFAVELNNRTWDFLESAKWTPEEAETMIHGAHASCYHWLQVGKTENHARALCLIANVYAALGQGTTALFFAHQCVGMIEHHADELADWDLAFAYDCVARANAADGNVKEARSLKRKAREFGNRIAVPEEKEIFDKWFADGNWHNID